jgi:ureidoacrylate peracid hydrolase
MKFAASSAALIAVDLQRGFIDDDGFVARQGRDVSPCREAARQSLRLVAAARAARMPVVWTRIVLANDYADGGVLINDLRPSIRNVGGLREDAPDTPIIAAAEIAPDDIVLDKKRNSAFFGTTLDATLRSRGIDNLVVCGVTTSMCVESTVRDAGQGDYRCFVPREASGDFARDRHEASLAAMEFGFARVVGIEEMLAAIARGAGEF